MNRLFISARSRRVFGSADHSAADRTSDPLPSSAIDCRDCLSSRRGLSAAQNANESFSVAILVSVSLDGRVIQIDLPVQAHYRNLTQKARMRFLNRFDGNS
jgi:hypothetical protein